MRPYYQAGNLNMTGATAAGMLGGSYGTNAIGGTRSPNLVGQVRVDQAWGLFQASVAAHDNHVAYYGASEATGHPDDKWGWAVQLALSIKNIPTGAGDTINISAVYTDGATRYNFQNLSGSSYAMFGSSGAAAYRQHRLRHRSGHRVRHGQLAGNRQDLGLPRRLHP